MKKFTFIISLTVMACIISSNAWSQKELSVMSDPYNPGVLVELSKNHAAFRSDVKAYFYSIGYAAPNGLYSTPFPAFTPFNFIAGDDGKTYYGGDIGPNNIYYCISSNFELMSIDRSTGAATFVANVTGIGESNITGMTYHAASNTMYVSSTSKLYTINLVSGETTLIGSFSEGILMIFIAINLEGDMYGVDISGDRLIKIDPASGTTTVIGPTNYPANFAQGGDFDDATGTLYWAAYQGGGVSSIRTLDLDTGNSTLVIDTYPYEIDALAIESSAEPLIPLSNWALYLGILLMITFVVIRFRRMM